MPADLPRRVLLVLHEERMGGASRGALLALEPLVDAGLDLHVWCAKPSPLHDELAAAGMNVDGAARPLRYSWARLREPPGAARRLAGTPGSLRAFRRHLRMLDPDLVHVNATLSLPEGMVARAAGYPVLFHFHEAGWPGAKGALLRRVAWRVGHEVAAVSRSNAEPLARAGRSPRILPEPVVVGDAPPPPEPRPNAVVAAVGALSPRKGSDVFVAAAERLAGEPVELLLVGGFEDAPSREWADALLERARRAGVRWEERIDVRAALPGWDIVVMPSRDDPFPLVVLEAMAAGRAVIGARAGGIEEQLAGGAGVLVPREDAAALAAAIAELAADPGRRAELGAAARERVQAYAAPRAAERLAEAYSAALAAAGRRARVAN